MNRVVEFLAQISEKVHRSKNKSSEKDAKLHHCPICDANHY
jgi:hypothetical protein